MPPIKKQTPSSPGRDLRQTNLPGIENDIKPMSFDDGEGYKVLLWGRSGTGKTTLWATFPSPILAVLCSGGFKPGELRSINTAENRRRISTLTLKNSADLYGVVDHVKTSKKFKTLVLDHVTGFQDLVIKELLGVDEIPVAKHKTAGKGESWSLVSKQQYGQATIICKEAFRAMLNLDCNVVLVGQDRKPTKDEDFDSEVITPTMGVALMPSLAGWLYPSTDYIAQTFIRNRTRTTTTEMAGVEVPVVEKLQGVEYCLRTGPHENYVTKFRVPRGGETLPDVIVDPTYDKIRVLIEGTE